MILAVWSARWLIRHSHAVESRPDRGRDGALSVLADQPDPCGGACPAAATSRSPSATSSPARRLAQNSSRLRSPAPRGQQRPDDPVQPGLPAPTAMAGHGTGHRPGRRPGQDGDPPREDRQLAWPGPDRVPGRAGAGAAGAQLDGMAARQRPHMHRPAGTSPVPQVPPGKMPALGVARRTHRHGGGQVKERPLLRPPGRPASSAR
jgi:hypothetical protein